MLMNIKKRGNNAQHDGKKYGTYQGLFEADRLFVTRKDVNTEGKKQKGADNVKDRYVKNDFGLLRPHSRRQGDTQKSAIWKDRAEGSRPAS